MTWPGKDGTGVITLAFQPIDGSPEVMVSETGSWAWLRMLREGRLQRHRPARALPPAPRRPGPLRRLRAARRQRRQPVRPADVRELHMPGPDSEPRPASTASCPPAGDFVARRLPRRLRPRSGTAGSPATSRRASPAPAAALRFHARRPAPPAMTGVVAAERRPRRPPLPADPRRPAPPGPAAARLVRRPRRRRRRRRRRRARRPTPSTPASGALPLPAAAAAAPPPASCSGPPRTPPAPGRPRRARPGARRAARRAGGGRLMQIYNQTGFPHEFTMAMDKAGHEYILLVVKGTFDFPDAPGGPVRTSETQVPLVMADEYTGAPGFSATALGDRLRLPQAALRRRPERRRLRPRPPPRRARPRRPQGRRLVQGLRRPRPPRVARPRPALRRHRARALPAPALLLRRRLGRHRPPRPRRPAARRLPRATRSAPAGRSRSNQRLIPGLALPHDPGGRRGDRLALRRLHAR